MGATRKRHRNFCGAPPSPVFAGTPPWGVMAPTATSLAVTPDEIGGPVLGLAEAARTCKVSIATVRRRKSALLELGASCSSEGWAIPVSALVQVGLLDRVTPPDTPSLRGVEPLTSPPGVTGSDSAVEELRRQLQAALHRAELAEALASERAAALEAERTALRMLTGAVEAAPSPGRRRWFRR